MMKKILGLLVCSFMILSLTGCGKEETKTLTCTMNMNESGINIDASVVGSFGEKSEKLTDYKINYSYDYAEFFEQLGLEVTDDVTEEMVKEVKKQLEKELEDEKGLTIEVSGDGSKIFGSIVGDYETLKKEYPDRFKKDGEYTYEGFKKKNTEDGFTCK